MTSYTRYSRSIILNNNNNQEKELIIILQNPATANEDLVYEKNKIYYL
jgi:hypothetical protein